MTKRQAVFRTADGSSPLLDLEQSIVGIETSVAALQQQQPSQSVQMKVYAAPAGSLQNGVHTLGTVVFDSANAYNSGTGLFTVPQAGYYLISASLVAPNVDLGANGYIELYASLNGSTLVSPNLIAGYRQETVGNIYKYVDGSCILFCSVGNTIGLYQNAALPISQLNVVFSISFLGATVTPAQGAAIDDNSTSTSKVWSSFKTASGILAVEDANTTQAGQITQLDQYRQAQATSILANQQGIGTNAASITSLNASVIQLEKTQTFTYAFTKNTDTVTAGGGNGFYFDLWIQIGWDGNDELFLRQPTARSNVWANGLNKLNGGHTPSSNALLTTNWDDYYQRSGFGYVEFTISSDSDLTHPFYRVSVRIASSSGLDTVFAQVTRITI